MVDIVTKDNEQLYRKAFALAEGHSEECINETVTDMALLLSKVCASFKAPVDEILEKIDVECFDKHLKKILSDKDCNCLKPKD